MNIFTLGGGFVSAHLPYPIIRDKVALSEDSIESILDTYKPDVLVNCIGKTGRPNIDWCESNKSETVEINTALPIILAAVCEKKSIRLIHIGSGCIFFGYKNDHLGWKESDATNPLSFYSKTKYACDMAIGDMSNVSVLRIRMPISTKNSPRNFINKIRNYSHIIDMPNSVTFLDDFVPAVDKVISDNLSGIYHIVNPEPLTAVDVMEEYRNYFPDHVYEIISESELNNLTKAIRSNCILDTTKAKSVGIELTPSKEALVSCMKQYVKNI